MYVSMYDLPQVETLSKELSERMKDYDRAWPKDVDRWGLLDFLSAQQIYILCVAVITVGMYRWIKSLPAAANVLGVTSTDQLMGRYDSNREGSLDAMELDELQGDLLKRLKAAQKLARQMDAISMIETNELESFDDEEFAQVGVAKVESNPLNLKSDM